MRKFMKAVGLIGETTERVDTPLEYDEYTVDVVWNNRNQYNPWTWVVSIPHPNSTGAVLKPVAQGTTNRRKKAVKYAHKAIRNHQASGRFQVQVPKNA